VVSRFKKREEKGEGMLKVWLWMGKTVFLGGGRLRGEGRINYNGEENHARKNRWHEISKGKKPGVGEN